jgi:predicted N-formylglutamate amidohydrolase
MAARHDVHLVTCEHGGHRIPPAWRSLFAGHESALASHRGWDPGALAMARTLAHGLGARLHYATVSRLLVDLNRSPGHPRLFSEFTRPLPAPRRQVLLARHYRPYRTRVERAVAAAVAAGGRVVHVSSHSFTPVLDGRVRDCDLGLLYDPRRPGESALCHAWQTALQGGAPPLRVRRNHPYRGAADGLTAWLRRHYPADAYLGIELEINQKLVAPGRASWGQLRHRILAALRTALTVYDAPAACKASSTNCFNCS